MKGGPHGERSCTLVRAAPVSGHRPVAGGPAGPRRGTVVDRCRVQRQLHDSGIRVDQGVCPARTGIPEAGGGDGHRRLARRPGISTDDGGARQDHQGRARHPGGARTAGQQGHHLCHRHLRRARLRAADIRFRQPSHRHRHGGAHLGHADRPRRGHRLRVVHRHPAPQGPQSRAQPDRIHRHGNDDVRPCRVVRRRHGLCRC